MGGNDAAGDTRYIVRSIRTPHNPINWLGWEEMHYYGLTSEWWQNVSSRLERDEHGRQSFPFKFDAKSVECNRWNTVSDCTLESVTIPSGGKLTLSSIATSLVLPSWRTTPQFGCLDWTMSGTSKMKWNGKYYISLVITHLWFSLTSKYTTRRNCEIIIVARDYCVFHCMARGFEASWKWYSS